jgi:hypothetical protein
VERELSYCHKSGDCDLVTCVSERDDGRRVISCRQLMRMEDRPLSQNGLR